MTKRCIVYHGLFDDAAAVFDGVGQPSDNIFFVSFIDKLFNTFSRVAVVFLQC